MPSVTGTSVVGTVIAGGETATGTAKGTAKPVLVGGQDGTNVVTLLTHSDGSVQVKAIADPVVLGAGTAEIGKLAAGSAVVGNVGLEAGANAIGKLAANSGVDIGDVDVTSTQIKFTSAFEDDFIGALQTTTGVNANGVGAWLELPVPCSKFAIECLRTSGSAASSIGLKGGVSQTVGGTIIPTADQGAGLTAWVADKPCQNIRFQVITIGTSNEFTIRLLALR